MDDLNLLIDAVRCLRLIAAFAKDVAPCAAHAYRAIRHRLRKTKRPNSQ